MQSIENTTKQSGILARQKPLGTGFGAATTAAEISERISLQGKTAIVTGGYSGLGRETARILRAAGAEVILPARDTVRARAALGGIDARVEPMDLLDPASIDAFADRFLDEGRELHILINSAGIMAVPFQRDARGYELQFATNHLGHFQLTTRLLPALREANGARIVSVSSWGHHFSPVLFEDPHFNTHPYDPWVGYGQSKTANILFALALDERLATEGIRAFSVHPGGIIDTNLAKYIPQELLRSMEVIDEHGNPVIDPSRNLKNVEMGAATQVWCATGSALDGMGGVYCENCDIAALEASNESATRTFERHTLHEGVLPYALDLESAERLWDLGEKLVFARG
jgi:NAD(P)-dependent dehydrogenase (short-subunit alcohol dehydrogenase family)